MRELLKSSNWVAGLQWLFFIFTNIVVIPITVGEAFNLESAKIVSLLQLSFILTGVACVVQAFFGHRRTLLEGQSGLWWGVILTLVTIASAQGIPLTELGGSIAIGVIISGILTMFIGLSGLGPHIAKLFNPNVMGVFMLLFATQLCGIFLKGMLGIPFGNVEGPVAIDLAIAGVSIFVAAIVILISIRAPISIRKYGLLIGIIIGWIVHSILFGVESSSGATGGGIKVDLFPFGAPFWNTGIVISTVLAGLLNSANTFGSLKGTDEMYGAYATKSQYRLSFTWSGVFTCIAGVLGLVPYSPFVSTIGFLNQTDNDIRRLPFVLGGLMFVAMGLIPAIGAFFSLLPLSVGSAALFVSYVQIFNSSLGFFKQVEFNILNVYRAAVPLFTGLIIMTMPAEYFSSLPQFIRPLVASGLLVGIILALFIEHLVPWDKMGTPEQKQKSQKLKEEYDKHQQAVLESK